MNSIRLTFLVLLLIWIMTSCSSFKKLEKSQGYLLKSTQVSDLLKKINLSEEKQRVHTLSEKRLIYIVTRQGSEQLYSPPSWMLDFPGWAWDAPSYMPTQMNPRLKTFAGSINNTPVSNSYTGTVGSTLSLIPKKKTKSNQ